MKPSLQLKQGLQLSLTPQLQQAIRLLQLSTVELQLEIQQALDSNPLLEAVDDDLDYPDYDSEATTDNDPSHSDEADFAKIHEDDAAVNDTSPEEFNIDSQWDDTYSSNASSASESTHDSDWLIDNLNHQAETIHDSLHWQIEMTSLVDSDRIIALAIIDSLNDDGFLSLPARQLYASLHSELDIDFEEFEAVRQLIHQLDPFGAATENLQEFLMLQLQQLPDHHAAVQDAKRIIRRYISYLSTRDYAQIRRKAGLSEARLKDAITLIQHLSPQPADHSGTEDTEYITPDVTVKKQGDHWLVELTEENAIKLRINSSYAALVKRADSSEDGIYLRNNLQEARWFIKSLQSRNETLLKVASKIVEHQRNFLEHGEEAMKPLILQAIAEDIGMHESTISRATTRKYIHTPQGIFELKYFFSSHLSTDTGGECSSIAIRAMIKKLINQENSQKPLSDNKLVGLLEEQGIHIARRTVAKYREAMAIPPSNERKTLA